VASGGFPTFGPRVSVFKYPEVVNRSVAVLFANTLTTALFLSSGLGLLILL
jgi:hypothetical protein